MKSDWNYYRERKEVSQLFVLLILSCSFPDEGSVEHPVQAGIKRFFSLYGLSCLHPMF